MSKNHIIIIDGTQSRIEAGKETNAGLLYKLLSEAADKKRTNIYYDPGIQGHGFWNWVTIASGWGINVSIQSAYNQLAAKYSPGDKIYLFGFSRGAYAVRSVSGMINTVGLVRKECATERILKQGFRLYEGSPSRHTLDGFKKENCLSKVQIEVIGVWDTVKALGLDYPVLSRLAPMATDFHDDKISSPVKFGFQALALHENRIAYRPVLWRQSKGWQGSMEQVWFRGAHSDIGGHVWRAPKSRALSNIPLVWMAKRAKRCGLDLPPKWEERFPCDANAPSVGTRRGIAKFFLFRKRRELGKHKDEFLHHSARDSFGDRSLPIPIIYD